MRLLVSLYMWSAWLFAGFTAVPIMLFAIVMLPRRKAYAVIRVMCRWSMNISGIKVVQRGLENLDMSKPHLLLANHVNLLDPFYYALVMPVPFNGVEKKENFKIPLYGWLMGRWGNVPIDRKNLVQAKQDLEDAGELMRKEGLWTIVMPEGTRTRDGYILPFKKGGFHLALATGVPIVPVSMNGAYEIQARGGFWAQPGTIELIFGTPIDPANYDLEHIDDYVRDVRAAVVASFTGLKSEADLALAAPALIGVRPE